MEKFKKFTFKKKEKNNQNYVPKEKTKKNRKFKFNKNTIKLILKIFLIVFIVAIIAGIIAITLFLRSIVKNAPDFDPNNLYQQESTIIYDSEGKLIAKLGTEKREKSSYEEMPEVLVDAIVATEDSRFFQHNGFDLPRFLVASLGQAMGKDAGGASTLTMQISKNSVTDKKYNKAAEGLDGIKRKFTDIYMSIFKIEKNYTKKEILEFYANYNFLGGTSVINGGAYGVEQACLTYFGKSAKDINLSEAALIAGLFQAPNAYDPYLDPEAAEDRRKEVLYLMERHGYITHEEREIAKQLTVDRIILKEHTSTGGEYQQFIDMVVTDIMNMYEDQDINPYTTPMEIWTTMDRTKQDHINSIMTGTQSPVTGLTYEWQNDVVQAGISVIDVNTGAVVAIGGARNQDGLLQYNYATMIKNQIGSTAKPLYDYGPGIEYENWSTYTPFGDEPHAYSTGVRINNWNHSFNGFLTLRQAVMGSWNIPALKAFQANNKENIREFVHKLGLSPEDSDGSLHEAHALGGYNGESPLTLSAAYAAFANGGYYIKPYSFTKIVFRDTGEVYENKIQKTRAMGEDTAYMIANVLVSTAGSALGRYSYVNGVQFGAKTGTSNYPDSDFKLYNYPSNAVNDIWVAGISPQYSIAVWYGYKVKSSEYYNVISSGQNSRIFQAIAQGIFRDNVTFSKPASVVSVTVEKESYPAALPSAHTPDDMKVTELFKAGTEPTEVSSRYDTLADVTNLKATISSGKATITWDPIATPDAISMDYLNKYFSSIYGDETYRQKYLNERLAYNNSNIGEIGYNVYIKDNSGELTLLGFTKDTSYTYTVGNEEKYTFVVKSCYTIFKNNISNGNEVTVKNDVVKIEISLKGDKTVNMETGKKYVDESVSVTENGKDVSSKALTDKNLDITIVRKSDKKNLNSFNEIDISKPDTYTVTYIVKYKNEEKVLTRTINYVEKKTSTTSTKTTTTKTTTTTTKKTTTN